MQFLHNMECFVCKTRVVSRIGQVLPPQSPSDHSHQSIDERHLHLINYTAS